MEKGEFFPNPGERRGSVHASLAAGGTTLIYEVHSGGSAGKLDGMLVIWWDRHANSYRFSSASTILSTRARCGALLIGRAIYL
jgi:hypothetical protein